MGNQVLMNYYYYVQFEVFSFILQRKSDFPLYTEAIKFFHHQESMVRIAVLTLTLNVCKGVVPNLYLSFCHLIFIVLFTKNEVFHLGFLH